MERDKAIDELKVKLDMLIKNYKSLEKYKEAAEILKQENEELRKKYEDLKVASSLSGDARNIRETRLYISRLIREIDRCIALLSA